jgi:hypothetical protein
MALKFDNYTSAFGAYEKAPKGSFKSTANNKAFVVIKESSNEYVGYIKNLANSGNKFQKAFTFKTAAEAKKLINIIAKKS